jgi:hypothetical protein
MNRYQISSPRKAFGIAAVAMTAISMGLSVVVPANLQSGARDLQTPEASNAITPGPLEVAASPLHTDVIGIREPELVSVQVRNPGPKRTQES